MGLGTHGDTAGGQEARGASLAPKGAEKTEFSWVHLPHSPSSFLTWAPWDWGQGHSVPKTQMRFYQESLLSGWQSSEHTFLWKYTFGLVSSLATEVLEARGRVPLWYC